ncbi:vitamin K epoxide reductase family protein [Candidatus Cyanaurora vandensis]|uniref:vitamin K epoxide reductase family protein n=1 Tax=Candidatus Cyanaurora vandensis TaxID=2714958 RepID=UPI00257F1689|nr:vitamin K epoxide reductase family protein [Candidatus Cyanaurora vandensis]
MDKIRLGMALLALGGLGVTGYLTYEKLIVGATVACGEGAGCNVVLASPYASVLGLPLAGFGFGLYAVILAFVTWPGDGGGWRWPGLWALTTMGIVFSGYLMSLLIFEIKAFCPYCLASALFLTTLWLTVLFTQKWSRSQAGTNLGLGVAGLTLVSSLLLYQIQKNTVPPPPAGGYFLNDQGT